MKIAINLRTFFRGRIGGLEGVVRELLRGLSAEQGRGRCRTVAFVPQSEVPHVREMAPTAELRSLPPGGELQTLERAFGEESFDLLLCPLLVLEPLTAGCPSVVWIPDLQHELYPELFPRQILEWRYRNYRASALQATRVVTLSEHSKATLCDRLRLDAGRIAVVYPTAEAGFAAPPSDASRRSVDRLGLPDVYLYYPANFWPHKNHDTLLRALSRLVRGSLPELHLVLTGAPSTGSERVARLVEHLALDRHVHLLGYRSRGVVRELYRRARALVFVSRYEGFGIPILEAFLCGTPVLASAATSCPEVAGDAALLVDPDDPRAIAEGIARLLADGELAARLRRAGGERARDFARPQAWEQTWELLAQAAHGRSPSRPRLEVREHSLVSVVTPSYNQARFLDETVGSVLSQSYPHIDYIVMDGGSTDGSTEILERYRDRLRYRSAPDRGQADAVNRGFEISRGSIFTFLNADDTYLPGAVARVVGHLTSFPGVGGVYGDACYTDDAGRPVERYPSLPFDFDALAYNCYICQPAAFLRSEVFDSVGRLDSRLHYALDYDLWIRVAKRHLLLKIDEELATSRMHAENKTLASRSRVFREIVQTVKRHYGYVPYSWIFGYANHLCLPRASFFDPPRARAAHPLSLGLGLLHNRRQASRFLREWIQATLGISLAPRFTGRWGDGWISKRYLQDLFVGDDARTIVIEGRHPELAPRPLALAIRLDGRRLARVRLGEPGPFEVVVDCPEEALGKACSLEIEVGRTFRVRQPADPRRLGCLIDAVRCET